MISVKKLTINDIAREAGVAKSTVSRYLNNGYVREENKNKIREIIEKYNYQPNSFAQSLKAKYSKMIGIIAPCLDSTVSSRIMMTIDETLRLEGYAPIIFNTNHDETLELTSINNLENMKVDGIILLATHISEQHKELFKQLSIPILIVAQECEECACIINDDYHAGYAVGQIVGQRCLNDVMYLGVNEEDIAVGKVRKQGVIDGLKQCGINHMDTFITDFDYDHAYITVSRVLDLRTPQVIICATDKIALGAYRAIVEHNLKIPEDISLIGFGGYEIAQLITPPLTTVRFDSEDCGKKAAHTIISMIKEEDINKKQVINFDLIAGNSVKNDNLI